jgi:hypothetical protein
MDAYAQPSDKSFFDPTDVDDTPKSRENPPWGWVWEIGQTLAALGSTVYLVYLLTHYDNRPLDDWRFHGLSFQATLAILSTAARAGAVAAVGTCLSQYKWLYFLRKPHRLDDLDVLDEASRGTLGSLRFLFIRVPSLATVGALLTIISLAYGAFIQQLVELKPEDIRGRPHGPARSKSCLQRRRCSCWAHWYCLWCPRYVRYPCQQTTNGVPR